MLERINANIADSGVGDVFVGNVHRFCSKFLFANGLVAAESSVIDEEDAVSILARYTGEDEYFVLGDFRRRREYSLIFHLESMMHQIAMGHPKALRSRTVATLKGLVLPSRKKSSPAQSMLLQTNLFPMRELSQEVYTPWL